MATMTQIKRMVEPPTVENFVNVIQKCRQKRILVEARQLHAYIREQEHEFHPVVGNYLVSMLVDCGDLHAAEQVFGGLPYRGQYSWSSLIAGYADCGNLQQALYLHQKMKDQGVPTKKFTYRALLKGCMDAEDYEKGRELHDVLVKEGLEGDPFIGSIMVDMYSRCDLLEEACHVFDTLTERDEVVWTVLIAAYAEQGFVEEVQRCLGKMEQEGMYPDASTFVCSLKACVVGRDPLAGYFIHTDIAIRGLEEELFVAHTLVDMYAKCGLLLEAQEVFNQLPVRSVVPWTALISGYVESGFGEEALCCLERMQHEGVVPVGITFVCSLKACNILGALHAGQEVHTEIMKRGLETEAFIGSSLVEMYAKCGCLAESRGVLGGLPSQNVFAWNTVVAGYAELGFGEEALICLHEMLHVGVSPNAITYACGLKACGASRALETGQKIHDEILKYGWGNIDDVRNALVDMYVKCSSFVEAQMLFDLLPNRSQFAWTSLVLGYVESGCKDEALICFKWMEGEAFSLDIITYACSLKACGMLEAWEIGRNLHAQVTKQGWEREVTIGNMLLNMYAKCSMLEEAQKVFDRLAVQGAEAWNSLAAAYADGRCVQRSLHCLNHLKSKGFCPLTPTYASILKACGSLQSADTGKELHIELVKRGIESEVDMSNTLVDMYARCGLLAEGCKSLDKISTENAIPWTSTIAGYAENGLGEEAVRCVEQMMLKDISPSANTFVFALKACGMVRACGTGQHLHGEASKRGWEGDIYVGTALVDMYAKWGTLVEASQVLERMPVRNAVSWNALMAGYVDHGLGEEALSCFTKMQSEDVYPGAVTYACVLKACALVEALETGWEVHVEIKTRGLESDPFVGSALVDMYGKCGSSLEAQKSFDTLPIQDVATWNALLSGYGENHMGDKAIQCYENMMEQGVKPDAITFICLLAACSHANLVDKGHEYYKTMVEQGLKPILDHYTCMVDILARSGRVYEAEKFAEDKHCLHTEEVLRALLSACRIHGEVELGLKCFQQLVQLNREDAAAYLLMADLYMCAGRWSDARDLENTRLHVAAKKLPAKASIQVNRQLFEFVVGDEQSEDMAEKREILSCRIKKEGYIPIVDLVLI